MKHFLGRGGRVVKEPPHTSCQEQDFCGDGGFTNFGRALFQPPLLGGGIVLEKTAEPWEPIQVGFDGRSDVINSSGNEYTHRREKLLVFIVWDSQLSCAGRISMTISKIKFYFMRQIDG